MKFDEWLNTIPMRQTPKGARLDLRLCVYPDGHGNFCMEDEEARMVGNPQPVNDPSEARDVLERIWKRAMSVKQQAKNAEPRRPTLAEQFADVIGAAPDLPDDMAAQHNHYIHGTPKS